MTLRYRTHGKIEFGLVENATGQAQSLEEILDSVVGDGIADASYAKTDGTASRSAADQGSDFLTALDFTGCDRTGASDSTTALQDRINAAATYAARGRNSRVWLPRGLYLHTGLTIPQVETGVSHGRLTLQGDGEINTELQCTATSGDALTIEGGRVCLRDLTLSASTARQAGSGNCVVADSGATNVTLAQLLLENVTALLSPGHGFYLKYPELVYARNAVADTCLGHGFYLYGAGGGVGGISNLFEVCRAISCAGNALRIDSVSESTFINFQALGCGGTFNSTDYHEMIFSNGRGIIFLNVDVEGKEKGPGGASAISDIKGMTCTGGRIYGGLFSGLDRGIVVSTDSYPVVIEYPNFTNAGYKVTGSDVPMTRAVELTAHPSRGRILLASSYTSVTNIVTLTGYDAGCEIRVGPTRLGQMLTSAGAPSTTPNWADQKCWDSTNSKMYIAIGTSSSSDWKAVS